MVKFFIRIIVAIVLSSPDPDDLAFFMNHLQPMASHWRHFGLQLGLLPGDLDNIAATPLFILGGPTAYLEEVLKRWMNRAPPLPTLKKLCDALRSPTVDQSRIALELEQQYQRRRTGCLVINHMLVVMISSLSCLTSNPCFISSHNPFALLQSIEGRAHGYGASVSGSCGYCRQRLSLVH